VSGFVCQEGELLNTETLSIQQHAVRKNHMSTAAGRERPV
jgi:hypothetical protein